MAQVHIIGGASGTLDRPVVRRIHMRDVLDALARGVDDFRAMPSHAVFLCLIYPAVGLFLGASLYGQNMLPLLYPLAAGFALVGPVAAIGLYELSRRREQGLDSDMTHVFAVTRSPSLPAILAIGGLLMVLLLTWLACAQWLYQSHFGVLAPESMSVFLYEVATTPVGWSLIVWGNVIGFGFALAALTIGVVSFPLLLDRDVGAAAALMTSVRAVWKNPLPMALWGLIVAALLLIGSLPAFVGLAVVMPVLGHATWHLYRKVVER